MAAVMTLLGKRYFLECGLDKDVPEDLVMRLGSNDVTPDEDSVLGDFTETTFTGYAAVTIPDTDWTITTPDVGGGVIHIVATADAIDFVSSAGSQDVTVYTAYLATVTSGILIAADRFSAPQIANHIVNIGDTKSVTPTISFTPSA